MNVTFPVSEASVCLLSLRGKGIEIRLEDFHCCSSPWPVNLLRMCWKFNLVIIL